MERKRQPNQSLNLELHLGLPPVEDLTPLNQSLITPEMACAFGIMPMPTACSTKSPRGRAREVDQPLKLFPEKSESDEYCKVRKRVEDSSGSDDCYSGGGDESGSSNRGAVKRPRLVWTPELHKRFVDVIDQLGVDKAVPKTIMEMMNVDGLTRENVASHLQKYRLYLKKADGNSNSNSISTTSTGGRSPTPTPTQTQKTTVFETGNGGLGPLPLPTGFHFNPMAMMPLLPPPPMLYGVGQFAGSGKLGFCGMESGGFTSSLLWNRHGG